MLQAKQWSCYHVLAPASAQVPKKMCSLLRALYKQQVICKSPYDGADI